MRAIGLGALLILTPAPLAPGAPDPVPESHRWICDAVREWKDLLRTKHPEADRFVPEVARRCQMPDD